MKKCTVYLADLGYVRLGQEWTIIPFPLNVAYIAAFLQRMRPGAFDIRIFKNPMAFLDAIEQQKPDIAALSNYIWNKNLQLETAAHLKKVAPECITVMGGPNYHFKDRVWLEGFAKENPQIDFHIEGEGEVKFYNVAACIIDHGMNLDAVKRANPAGVAFIDPVSDRLVSNELSTLGTWTCLDGLNLDMKAGRLVDLNDVPSPYLTGLLDEFLADPNYCPIIETNRGCPYECTFCNWGELGKAKSSKFAHDRVEQELRYIAEKNVSTTPILYLADANFGLFERDVEIATLLHELKDTHGFPQNVYLYYAKNATEKVVRIATILVGMTRFNLSRQTLNDEVLANIKRGNISIDTFNRLAELAHSLGSETYMDMIYGLPGETKESFFAGLRTVMRQRVDGIHWFPAMLLNGSEMGSQASRDQYGLKGEFRRIDGCSGQYGPITAMEFEEIITRSNAMSREDYFEIRLFHVFQTLFLDSKLYRATETLIGDALLFDLIEDIIANLASAPAPVRKLVDEFMAAAKAELLVTPPKKATPADVEATQTALVKLNPLFVCKLLFDPGVRESFHAFVKERILTMGHASEEDVDNVLRHIDESLYPFDGSVRKSVRMAFDPAAFLNRPLARTAKVSDYALAGTKAFRYTKDVTFQQFLEKMPADEPLASKVYEVLVHHTHQNLRKTVSWSIEGPETDHSETDAQIHPVGLVKDDGREIENEEGWIY